MRVKVLYMLVERTLWTMLDHAMADILERLQTLLDKAAHDARIWDDVCEEVTTLLGATGTLLPASNPHFRGLWTAGTKRIKQAMVVYLRDKWIHGDPREPVLNRMFERGYCTDDEIYPDRAARSEMPIYRDFLKPWNFGNVCMIRLQTPQGYWPMTVHFANDHPPLGDADFALIVRIQSLFANATKAASDIAHQRIYDFFQFMNGSETEVFVFDADGHQSFTIDRQGRVQNRDRLDRLLPAEISASIQDALKEVLLSDPDMSMSRAYQFIQDGKHVNVLVIQIPPSLRHFFMTFKTCAIRTELGDTSVLKRARLLEEFGLTKAETMTVELLANGKTTAMIADLMGLKPASIRQRLKMIYQKTDVSSQVALVALYGGL